MVFVYSSGDAFRDFQPYGLKVRADLHMSQEPWPCDGEDPWLSSKGCTMGVGKAILCSHKLLSIVWSENEPCCKTIAYFVGGKREEDLVWHNMSQTLSIWENYLVVLVCHGIYYGICWGIFPTICPLGKIFKKIVVSRICVRLTSWRWA